MLKDVDNFGQQRLGSQNNINSQNAFLCVCVLSFCCFRVFSVLICACVLVLCQN